MCLPFLYVLMSEQTCLILVSNLCVVAGTSFLIKHSASPLGCWCSLWACTAHFWDSSEEPHRSSGKLCCLGHLCRDPYAIMSCMIRAMAPSINGAETALRNKYLQNQSPGQALSILEQKHNIAGYYMEAAYNQNHNVQNQTIYCPHFLCQSSTYRGR